MAVVYAANDLAEPSVACRLIYRVHLIVSIAYSLGIAGTLRWRPELTKLCGRHFVLLKLLHVACSAVGVVAWPGEDGWGLIVATDVLMLHCWMGTLSLRNTLILISTALILFVTVMGALERLWALAFVKAVALAAGAAWITRSANYRQRIQWRLHHLFTVSTHRFRFTGRVYVVPAASDWGCVGGA